MAVKKKQSPDLDKLIADGVVRYGNDEHFRLQRISWGIPELDAQIGGGIPRNRITLLSGAYSSGKSFLVQQLCKTSIEAELKVAYVDTERSYDPGWWEAVGLPTEKVIVSQPPTGEKGIDAACALAEAGMDVVAIDSLAGLIPEEVLTAEAEQRFIGSQARLINRLMQGLIGSNHKAAVICTNQLRSSLAPGPMDTMPGGWGQLFFSHLILRISRDGWIEDHGRRVGFNMNIACRKSKVSNFEVDDVKLPYYFRGEIDQLAMLVDRAIEEDLIHQSGPWYRFLDTEEQVLGRNTVLDRVRDDAELRERIERSLGDRR